MFGIPNQPPANYLTLSLRALGFDTFKTNLLIIPYYVFQIFTMFAITIISEMVNERTLVSMAEDLWTLPFLIGLFKLKNMKRPWLTYGLTTALLSYPYTHPIQVAWCSRNSGAVASRTVNASLYNMFVQASAIIASQMYLASDAPLCKSPSLRPYGSRC
jgi:hypothetical protein